MPRVHSTATAAAGADTAPGGDSRCRADAILPPRAASDPRRDLGLARRSHLPRTIGLALGFLMVASVMFQRNAPPATWLGAILYCFGFPHLAWWLARRSANPSRAERRNLLGDHLLGGCATALMAFNLLPSVLTLCLLCMNSMAGGGKALMVRGLACHALGLAIGLALFGLHVAPESTMLNVLACIPVMLMQPLAVSLTARFAIDKLQGKRKELEHQSRHDGLSGLYNRAHWEAQVHAEFERCRRTGQPATLVMADLDHFKRINDVHGHAAGDEAIRRFAETLRCELRLNDVPGRYGGEEFGLLLPGTTAREAREVIERLRAQLHQRPLLEGVRVTASFGAVALAPDVESHTVWLRLADQMLYRAKHLGRDRIATLGEVEMNDRPAPADDTASAHACIEALNDRAVVSHLLVGADHSQSAIALFDPRDHLMLANAAFRALYHVQPGARSFPEIVRHCHQHRVGPAIAAADIEAWLRVADGKRRSQPHRSFTVDMLDGSWHRADESSFSDGWILLILHRIETASDASQ